MFQIPEGVIRVSVSTEYMYQTQCGTGMVTSRTSVLTSRSLLSFQTQSLTMQTVPASAKPATFGIHMADRPAVRP